MARGVDRSAVDATWTGVSFRVLLMATGCSEGVASHNPRQLPLLKAPASQVPCRHALGNPKDAPKQRLRNPMSWCPRFCASSSDRVVQGARAARRIRSTLNIYEFLEVLNRQKWFLLIGLGVLLPLIVGVWLTIDPKYTATVRMVVVEGGITDLTDAGLATSDFNRIAEIYGDLLSSTEAREEIAAAEGVEIQDLRLETSERTSLFELSIDSPTSEGAEAGALGGFSWLQERLRQGPEVVIDSSEDVTGPPVTVDETGRVEVELQLEVESLYSDADPSLWFEIDTFQGDDFATPLALLEPVTSFPASVDPERDARGQSHTRNRAAIR